MTDAGPLTGRADTVLTVLDARGVEVPAAIRAEIQACTDVDRLDLWIRRAATIRHIEDLDSHV